jgi:hypothetical protein
MDMSDDRNYLDNVWLNARNKARLIEAAGLLLVLSDEKNRGVVRTLVACACALALLMLPLVSAGEGEPLLMAWLA